MRNIPASGIAADQSQSITALDAADVVGRWDVDVSRELVTADALVAFLFGFTPEQADQGITLDAFNGGVHPDDRAHAMDSIHRCVREGGWFITEHRVCSADGQTRKILARGRFDKDESGAVSSGRGIVVDITNSQRGNVPLSAERVVQTGTTLEQVTDLILASHAALKDTGEPFALVLTEALLMELGRSIARLQTSGRRDRLH